MNRNKYLLNWLNYSLIHGLPVFYCLAILAAVMSTLSAQLLISSSSITEDFYKGFIRPKASEKELVWLGRAMVLVIAGIAIWIAQDENSKVLKLVEFAWAGFGSAFGPVVLFSLFWNA